MNPLADAGARRRAETEGQYLTRWQIALYELILTSAVVGSAWIDLWLSKLMVTGNSVIFDFLRVFEDMGDSKWFLVTASCWMLGCLMLLRLVERADWRAHLKWAAQAQGWLIGSVAISGIVANLFKILFGRARPAFLEPGQTADWTLFATHWGHHSFPSGHATTLFAAAYVLARLFPRLAIVFWGAALLGGLGRIAEGDHFLSDVIAGAALGGFIAWWLEACLARRNIRIRAWQS